MDEDEDQTVTLAAVRLDWTDAPIIALGLVVDILDSFSQATANVRIVLGMHANWRLERKRFSAAVGQDIDVLLRGSDGDPR